MIGDLATTVASSNYPIPITQLPNHSITKSTFVTSLAAASSLILIAALGWPYVSARVRMFKDARDIRSRIVDRLDADAALVRAELETAPMSVAQRAALRARLVEATSVSDTAVKTPRCLTPGHQRRRRVRHHAKEPGRGDPAHARPDEYRLRMLTLLESLPP